jgi:hypothetical protein
VALHSVVFDGMGGRQRGWVRFSAPILGLVMTDDALAATDALEGVGVLYLGHRMRGLEPGDRAWIDPGDRVRISEIPDSDFTNSRTAVSVNPGHPGDGWSLRCCHSSLVMISGFSVWVNPGFSLCRRMLSPFNSIRWALWMIRSRMASAMVGSPII